MCNEFHDDVEASEGFSADEAEAYVGRNDTDFDDYGYDDEDFDEYDSVDEYDGQPTEYDEWQSFDPDCWKAISWSSKKNYQKSRVIIGMLILITLSP